MIDPAHRKGVTQGWQTMLDSIARDFRQTSGRTA
jgi:hypothetical protein